MNLSSGRSSISQKATQHQVRAVLIKSIHSFTFHCLWIINDAHTFPAILKIPELGEGDIGGRRLVKLTLRKTEVGGGKVIVWWQCVFKGDPEVDTSKFQDRKTNASFQRAWTEAHEKFKQEANNITVTEVDIGNPSNEDDDDD
jgi:hypothetical protein